MHQFKRTAVGMALVAAALVAGTAHADVVTLNLGGISSNAELGDASNETRSLTLLPGVRITNISWNVSLTANSPSWLSEIGVDLNDGALAGVSLFPGIGDDFSGSGSYIGTADLIALGFDFYLGASGVLNFEFFESFDDALGGADGFWNRGSFLQITYVPEPASYGLAAIALLGAGLATRRRKS
ncbi:MAG: PEP-CTERM sorting domain-containing protein [Roseateles sp.]|uniref:PEP-CTERM sorting domain-containing protein n=1 Tax=Roseateles sp. TaxID=1971397 RepID=UPI0040361F65